MYWRVLGIIERLVNIMDPKRNTINIAFLRVEKCNKISQRLAFYPSRISYTLKMICSAQPYLVSACRCLLNLFKKGPENKVSISSKDTPLVSGNRKKNNKKPSPARIM